MTVSRYIIAYIGLGRYDEATYAVEALGKSESVTSKYSFLAGMELFNAERVFVICNTEQAQRAFDDMVKDLKSDTRYRFEDHSSIEKSNVVKCVVEHDSRYSIIEEIVAEHNESAEWIFDITLAQRNLSFEATSVLAFLAVVHPHIHVYGTVYADMKNPDSKTKEFVYKTINQNPDYTEWTRATDAFIRYGQADQMSKLMESDDIAVPMRQLKTAVIGVSDGLHTANMKLLEQSASDLVKTIDELNKTLKHNPLMTLLTRIKEEYREFIRTDTTYLSEILFQRKVMHWYITKHNWALAIQLASEHLKTLYEVMGSNEITATLCAGMLGNKQKLRSVYSSAYRPIPYMYVFEDPQHRIVDAQEIIRLIMDENHQLKQYLDACLWIEDQKKFDQTSREEKQLIFDMLGGDASMSHDDVVAKFKLYREKQLHMPKKEKYQLWANIVRIVVERPDDILHRMNQYHVKKNYYEMLTRLCKSDDFQKTIAHFSEVRGIGEEVRAIRNQVAHLHGREGIDTVRSLCERVELLSKQCISD